MEKNQFGQEQKSSGGQKTGYGNVAIPDKTKENNLEKNSQQDPNKSSQNDDLANSSRQQFGSDRPTPDERSNRDRTGKYDEADPIWVNPDVQMNNEDSARDVSNSLVDSQTKAP